MKLISSIKARSVHVSEETLSIALEDGRVISAPIEWFPRLAHGSDEERNNHGFIGNGLGIHWPGLDEDISVENLLAGKPSAESQESLQRWLNAHNKT